MISEPSMEGLTGLSCGQVKYGNRYIPARKGDICAVDVRSMISHTSQNDIFFSQGCLWVHVTKERHFWCMTRVGVSFKIHTQSDTTLLDNLQTSSVVPGLIFV